VEVGQCAENYSSSFFFRFSALPNFDAAFLALLFFAAAFFSGASLTSVEVAASGFAARFNLGAAAAPPRLALLLAAVLASPALPSACASLLSLETRIVT